MSKNKTKKKKNKQKIVSSNNKKTKAEEKNVKHKKDDVKKTKSDTGDTNNKKIKKEKDNGNSGKNNIIKEAKTDAAGIKDAKTDAADIKDAKTDAAGIKETKTDAAGIKEAKTCDRSTENNGIGKNIIRQGNKLIFSDADNEIKSEDTKAPYNNANLNEAASSNAAYNKHQNTDRGSFFENKLELAVMSKKERRTAKKAAYREYTSTMTGKERVSYFFYCYKWHIIIPICCILLIICYGMTFYRNSRPKALSYIVLNADEFDKSFHEDYLSYFNMPENHVVRATAGYIVNYDYYKKNTVSASREGTDYSTLALTCETGTFDVIIGDGAGIQYCTFVEIVKPLDLYFTEEQYAALEGHIVKFQDSSYTFYPYAVDISDTEFAKGLGLEYSKVYMAFPGISEENMTNSLRLLEYVLGIKLAE